MKYVVITGASRGIGRAIAEIFAKNGYHLLLTSRNDYTLYQTVEALQTQYESVTISARAYDLSVKQQAQEFGAWCIARATPDILVNNAGGYEPGNIGEEPDGALERQMAVNLYGAYHVTRAVLPAMKTSKSGHIFNMGSIASLQAYPNGGAYSISKYALHGFSTNLRKELQPHQIKVTTVFPGAVFTDSWQGFDNSAQRIMVPTDVAQMIFAASQLSFAACVEDIVLRPQLGDL